MCSAPEKLEAEGDRMYRFGKPSDVWSMGIALWQLAFTDMWGPYGPGLGIANLVRQVRGRGLCFSMLHTVLSIVREVKTLTSAAKADVALFALVAFPAFTSGHVCSLTPERTLCQSP